MPDPKLEGARRTLAEIEADIRHSQRELDQALGKGVDHFKTTLNHLHQGLDDEGLDTWTEQAAGMH